MTSSPPTRWQPGRRPVLVPDLGAQLLAPLAVLEELLTDLAVWEDEDVTDPFRARQGLWLPAPLAGRGGLGAGGGGRGGRPGGVGGGGEAVVRPHPQPVPRPRTRSATCPRGQRVPAAERGRTGGGGHRGPVGHCVGPGQSRPRRRSRRSA